MKNFCIFEISSSKILIKCIVPVKNLILWNSLNKMNHPNIHLWPFQMKVLLIIIQMLASIKFCEITNLLSTKPPWALPVMSNSWRQIEKGTRNVIVIILCEMLTYWHFFQLLAMGEEEMSKQLRMWTAKSCF